MLAGGAVLRQLERERQEQNRRFYCVPVPVQLYCKALGRTIVYVVLFFKATRLRVIPACAETRALLGSTAVTRPLHVRYRCETRENQHGGKGARRRRAKNFGFSYVEI